MEEKIQEALHSAYEYLGFNAPWLEVEVFLGEAWEDHLAAVQFQWAEDHAPNH